MWPFTSASYAAVPATPDVEESEQFLQKEQHLSESESETFIEKDEQLPPRPSRSWRIFRLCIFPLTLLFVVAAYFLVLHIQQGREHEAANVVWDKETYIQQVLDNEVPGPYNNNALATLCSTKTPVLGLIIRCEAPAGGVGNVRNVFLNCVRYAIEAGATSLIIPQIMKRADNKIDLQTGTLLPFTYLFDEDYFTTTLEAACPHLSIISDLPSLSTLQTVTLDPKTLARRLVHSKWPEMISPAGWSAAFTTYLATTYPSLSASNPAIIELKSALFQWQLGYETRDFIASFGRILRFREDVRRLSGAVLFAMNSEYGDGNEVEFYGGHLRTASDAKKAGWTAYAMQADNLLADAQKHNLSPIYLASGSPSDTDTFITTSASLTHPIATTTKNLLLSSPALNLSAELAELQALTWDQQALVDYEVLLRSKHFGGTWESSFVWNIAVRRGHGGMGGGRQGAGKGNGGRGVMWGDKASTIFGPGVENKAWWFEEGMWP